MEGQEGKNSNTRCCITRCLHYENAVKHHGADSKKAQDKFGRVKVALSTFREQFEEHMADGLLDGRAIQTISGYVQQFEDAGL